MNKYKSFLILLGILCAVLVGASFMIAGTPVSQQAISLDQIRLNNFSEIHRKIDEYYRINTTIPTSLNELNFDTKLRDTVLLDPEVKSPYEYKPIPDLYSFDLCTTFSTDSSETEDQYYGYSEFDTTHTKGYDCITYKVSSYLLTPTPIP